ncbi:hypothetical protein RHSIM_Rhsim01G0085100 [Rhododendron simsii]|uniref:Uncharacterized protein n=1 Tax=Rhododendron simsii TaxID=118357 RepID=A0A834HFM7_RHOSS|nr:hypothetical protein RHSIM_Rhsim01G0085100 [Rhododendron simsii]
MVSHRLSFIPACLFPFHNLSTHSPIELMETDLNIPSSAFDEGRSSVDPPLFPITTISGWDDPLPSNPPVNWSANLPTERVIVKMEDPPLYPNFSIRRSHVKVSYQFPWVREEPMAMLLDSLLSMHYRPMPFQLAEVGGKPSLENHESLFERAKNQQPYWKEVVRKPCFLAGFSDDQLDISPLPENPYWFQELEKIRYNPPLSHAHVGYSIYGDSDENTAKELLAAFAFLDVHILEEYVPYLNFLWACETLQFYDSSLITTHLHGFKSALPHIRLWMKTSTAAHYDPFWVDYEVHHEKVVKLHNKVLDLNNSNWELPPNPSRTLLKKHQSWLRRRDYKRANLLAKAKKSVMAMRPLIDKKIKMDAEEMARDRT